MSCCETFAFKRLPGNFVRGVFIKSSREAIKMTEARPKYGESMAKSRVATFTAIDGYLGAGGTVRSHERLLQYVWQNARSGIM